MKILKFGGTSTGSALALSSLRDIVERERFKHDLILVVSAMEGITDRLIETAGLALKGNALYNQRMDSMLERHLFIIDSLMEGDSKEKTVAEVTELFNELRSILLGVRLIRDLSPKTLAAIVSYGELCSAAIVRRLIPAAAAYDSRRFIITRGKDVATNETYSLVRETFQDFTGVAVVPGFISRDRTTGETTNLGRGGSDYTAALIAAALDADMLEIWTDVDGFMTGDPAVVPAAYTISELSYSEATELCNFGARVIYPPTIYPVCVKDIPISVRNILRPDAPGTIIRKEAKTDQRDIRGMSSIADTTLITVSGLSMVGVIGVNRRIFSTLADNGISVFMVCQASSENSTSIAVRSQDADRAVEVLNEEFSSEILTGAMFPMQPREGLATIAIVGANMKDKPGVAGKFFGILGRSGISVIAFAQGASETNISAVVRADQLIKALNAIHDSFFLSEYTVLNLFICGVGVVGGKLIEQIRSQHDHLMKSRRLKLNVVGIANSRKLLLDPAGLDLTDYREQLAASPGDRLEASDLASAIIQANLYNSVFVDCTASAEIAGIYQDLLSHSISVVAANKIAASSNYRNYLQLKNTALSRGVKFRFETNVGAGLPIIGTINDLCNSGDRILKIEAVLSGTLNFIFNDLSADNPFSQTVVHAKEQGFSEPDPRIDLSGVDVVRKLVILTREAGYEIEADQVEKNLFLPRELFEGSVEDFMKRLPDVDAGFEQERRRLESLGRKWRFVAEMENGKARVGLREIDKDHPFYNLEGSNNIVLITTERYRDYPMQIKGYGAGANVTAAGVFANVLSIANI